MRISTDRIAIVRALPGIGEMLCAIPALRAVRDSAPRAQITLIGLESSAWVLDRFDTYVDELLPFPGFPGVPGVAFDARATLRFLADAQEREFDLAIQLHDASVTWNAFTRLLGATRTAGTVLPGQARPDRELFVELHPAEAEPLRLLRVVENLGAGGTRDAELEFIFKEDDEAELDELDLEPGAYVCLHPHGCDAELVDGVTEALDARGLSVVRIGDDPEELSLGATAAVLRDAALTICADSNIAQLAAAVAPRSVVVFAPGGDLARWAPLDRERHRALGGDVTVEDVVAAADALLSPAPAESGRP